MQQAIDFASFFLLRTPLLPFAAGADLSEAALRAAYKQPVVSEALFLASPSLHQVVATWLNRPDSLASKDKERLELTLRKYLLRMSYRCTPFGLFAGITPAGWGTATSLRLTSDAEAHRRTRLDMGFLCALAANLARQPAIRQELTFFPNNTLYAVKDKYRYVEYSTTPKGREHSLVSVDKSDYLEEVLAVAKSGQLPAVLAATLVSDTISEQEARDFIEELIDSQVLVSNLEPIVTGNYTHALCSALRATSSGQEVAELLAEVENRLARLDSSTLGAATHMYAQIEQLLSKLQVSWEPGQLFQVDMRKASREATLSNLVQQEIANALPLLLAIQPEQENEDLRQFRLAFTARYEQQEVPLTEALDVEMGLDYPVTLADQGDQDPLLADLPFAGTPGARNPPAGTQWQQYLLRKITGSAPHQDGVLDLSDVPPTTLPSPRALPLPDSMSFTGAVLATSAQAVDEGNYQVVGKFIGGPSAANLLGRFCDLSEELTAAVRAELRAEEARQPDAIFAEIVHINQARVGNISTRPLLRDYEIPIVSQAGVGAEHTLPLADLRLSVRGNQLILRSHKFNKRVIPRLSSAHNFSANTLPAYRFLADLQKDQLTGHLGWNWGSLRGADFLPRVVYNKLILAPARWTLTPADQTLLLDALDADLHQAIEDLRARRGLPPRIVVTAGDHTLPIDLTNSHAVMLLRSMLHRRMPLTVEECLFTSANTFVSSPIGTFTNEVILPLRVRQGTPAVTTLPKPASTLVRRNFSLGSEWAYAKIYCGSSTADELLSAVIRPLTEKLVAAGILDGWFFIRYADPASHLRVRFTGGPLFYNRLIEELSRLLAPYEEAGIVANVQYATYSRELERYGSENIGATEVLFHHDSVAVTKILAALAGEPAGRHRWLCALLSVDWMLRDFGYDTARKQALLHHLQAGFKEEFNSSHPAARKLYGHKYRQERAAIERILQQDQDATGMYKPAFSILAERSQHWRASIDSILAHQRSRTASVTLDKLLESYIHMSMNRFFKTKQRMYEAVLYDLLHQHYKSMRGRATPGA